MNTSRSEELREKAEQIANEKNINKNELKIQGDLQHVLYELEVQRIEIELQTQELWIAEAKGETALEKLDFYFDKAPVGYFTLCREGKILDMNTKGAEFLGHDKSFLEQKFFWQFVSITARPNFLDFFYRVFESNIREAFQGGIKIHKSSSLVVDISGKAFSADQECRLSLVDKTSQQMLEEKLRRTASEIEQLKITLGIKDKKIMDLQDQVYQLLSKLDKRNFSQTPH